MGRIFKNEKGIIWTGENTLGIYFELGIGKLKFLRSKKIRHGTEIYIRIKFYSELLDVFGTKKI